MKCPQCGYREETRTEQQNRLLWAGAYSPIAEFLSEQSGKAVTTEMIHWLCKEKFLPPLVVPLKAGDKTYPGSTTKLTKSEFSDYIEKVWAWGASMGVFFDTEAA